MGIYIEIPPIKKDMSGVYAIIFDEFYTYIGSSSNIYDRVNKWVNLIKKRKSGNGKMKEVLADCEFVRFEIVHIVSGYLKRLAAERYYIFFSQEKGLYKNIINQVSAPHPNLEKIWSKYSTIPSDGNLIRRPKNFIPIKTV